jgi:hypothetical protein
VSDTSDIASQTLVVEEEALARFVGHLSAPACSVLKGIQLTDHHIQIGLFGCGGSCCTGDMQAASKKSDEGWQSKSVSECSAARELDHGWALVIPGAISLPFSSRRAPQENHIQVLIDFFRQPSSSYTLWIWRLKNRR